MTLGEYLKQKRLEKGLTQTELAEKLKIPYQRIQEYENNKNMPALKNGLLIIKILDIDLKEIEKILNI